MAKAACTLGDTCQSRDERHIHSLTRFVGGSHQILDLPLNDVLHTLTPPDMALAREREMGIAYHFGALDTTRCTNAWPRTRYPLKTHVCMYTRSLVLQFVLLRAPRKEKNTRQGRL